MKIYEIYQIKEDAPNRRSLLFSNLDLVKSMELEVKLENYEKVYQGVTFNDFTAEDIYMKFNLNRPDDFKGHSLSVSDIVKIDGKYFYCDSFGFKEIEL